VSGEVRYWAVVPAAGVGSRMGGPVPKQYLKLQGRMVIDHTLERLLGHASIRGVYVALSKADRWWPESAYAGHPAVIRVTGGRERCYSVLNALSALEEVAHVDDWVLVHDAARPCLRTADIDRLIEALAGHPVGGLLAVPVHDTVKRATGHSVVETVPREALWRAYTPQMFRLGALKRSLSTALEKGWLVTDESSALELMGKAPKLVEGHTDNIKITRPEDLALADFFLARQKGQS